MRLKRRPEGTGGAFEEAYICRKGRRDQHYTSEDSISGNGRTVLRL